MAEMVVDRLYLIQPGGVAIRYSAGVGREEALNFRGSAALADFHHDRSGSVWTHERGLLAKQSGIDLGQVERRDRVFPV